MKKWMIYYGDGTRFTWEDGSPYDAPRTNVQIICTEETETGWELQSDNDYYYYDADIDVWFGADQFAVFDVLIRCKRPLIFFGRYIPTDDFKALFMEVLAELPTPKTAWRRGKPPWLRSE